MQQPLQQQLQQLANKRLARRALQMSVRAAWLCLCIWCVALGGHLLWGWPWRADWVSMLMLAVVGATLVLLLRHKLSPAKAARSLDRRFHLDEQLSTALEVAAHNPAPSSIAARLVLEASTTSSLLQRRIARRQRPPWHDLLTLMALGFVALGLWVIAGVTFPNLSNENLPLPALATIPDSPDEPISELPNTNPPPPIEDMAADQANDASSQASTTTSNSADPRVLQMLADALRDQGITRPAANALDRGDLNGAAQALRELADQASQLSQQTRDNLANNLKDAAQKTAANNPQLAEQLEQSAAGLTQGDQNTAQALDDLARAIEQLQTSQTPDQANNGQAGQATQPSDAPDSAPADQPESGAAQAGSTNGAGDGSGEQRQSASNNPLNVEGQPVPLETDGNGQVPAEASGQTPNTNDVGASNGGFVQGDGSTSSQQVQVGDDPQRVPNEERDVVQDYFQPQK